jgi:hypothetical protein
MNLACPRIKPIKKKWFKMKTNNKISQDNNFQKVGTKGPRRMELVTVMGHFTTNKEGSIQVTGTITRWMVMELYIILMVELLIKVNGKMTHFMEKVS